jgi:hypothetical protein
MCHNTPQTHREEWKILVWAREVEGRNPRWEGVPHTRLLPQLWCCEPADLYSHPSAQSQAINSNTKTTINLRIKSPKIPPSLQTPNLRKGAFAHHRRRDAQIPNPKKAPNPKNTVETVFKARSLYTGATRTNTYSTKNTIHSILYVVHSTIPT